MNVRFKTRPVRGVRASRVAMALIPLALAMAGCSGTLQTQSATPNDTYYRWKPQMETLPIEVHGGFRQGNSNEIAQHIPYGTTPYQYAAAKDGQEKLATVPRIVLYLGSASDAANGNYCDARSAAQPATTKDGDVHVVAALCDGPRLVDVTMRDVQNDRIQQAGMVSIIKSIKRRLLFGLSANNEIVAAEYGNS